MRKIKGILNPIYLSDNLLFSVLSIFILGIILSPLALKAGYSPEVKLPDYKQVDEMFKLKHKAKPQNLDNKINNLLGSVL